MTFRYILREAPRVTQHPGTRARASTVVMERAWRPMDKINEGVAIRFEVDNAAATLVPTGFA